MCRTLCVAKTVSIGYITSMVVHAILALSRGMRQTFVIMERRNEQMD